MEVLFDFLHKRGYGPPYGSHKELSVTLEKGLGVTSVRIMNCLIASRPSSEVAIHRLSITCAS